MKRSDVIHSIEIELSPYFDITSSDKRICAESIINTLEELGIIRPIKVIENSETLVINQFGQVVAKTDDSEVIEIGWEEE